MKKLTKEIIIEIGKKDDLKIAPFRADGKTYGTLTWIWNVEVDGKLYVRAYNGKTHVGINQQLTKKQVKLMLLVKVSRQSFRQKKIQI